MDETGTEVNRILAAALTTKFPHDLIFGRLDRDQWRATEKEVSPFQTLILNLMANLGGRPVSVTESTLTTYGDELYCGVRDMLVQLSVLQPLKSNNQSSKKVKVNGKKKNGKPGSVKTIPKSDQIIMENKIKTFKSEIVAILTTYTPNNKTKISHYGFNSKIAEARIVTFLLYLHVELNYKQKEMNESRCYELIMGVLRIINNISNINGISNIAVTDLKEKMDQLAKKIKFNYMTLFTEYPKYCLSTQYDAVFPSTSIQPYKSQVDVVEAVKNNSENGVLILLKAMIGQGKTSGSAAIASFAQLYHSQKKANGQIRGKMLFVCSIKTVRIEAGSMCYQLGIPFANSSLENDMLRTVNSFSAKGKADNDIIVVIADPATSIRILQEKPGMYDFMFWDEPTVGADIIDHPFTVAGAHLMMLAPKITIMSSATLPKPEQINNQVTYFKARYPNANIIQVSSNESQIGAEMISFSGRTFIPIEDCQTVIDLQQRIEKIKHQPMLCRLFTAIVVGEIHQRMTNAGLTIKPFNELFSNAEKLNQVTIQTVAFNLLDQIVNEANDETVKQICKPIQRFVEKQKTEKVKNDMFESSSDEEDNEQQCFMELDNMFTSFAHTFAEGPCLVVDDNPFELALRLAKPLLDEIGSVSRYIKDYQTSVETYQKNVERIEKDIKQEEKRSIDLDSLTKPKFSFPDEFRINSIGHLKKYAPNKNKKNPFLHYSLESLDPNCLFSNELMGLLALGIGVVSSKNNLPEDYTTFVLKLASTGSLQFIFADESIVYGTNYPFLYVIVTNQFSKGHSIQTIFQAFGRAGRVGASWAAFIIIEDELIERIRKHLLEQEEESIEAENMNKAWIHIIKKMDDMATKKQQKKEEMAELTRQIEERKIREEQLRLIQLTDLEKRERHKREEEESKHQASSSYVPPHLRNKNIPDENGWRTTSRK